MGRIVYAAAMSHVLHPPYYEKHVGPHGKRMVEELIAVVGDMGRKLAARRPDALVVVADDHLNVFSFDAVPAMCVRIGRSVRSEEHTSELQSPYDLVCRLLLEKKKKGRPIEAFHLFVRHGAPGDIPDT